MNRKILLKRSSSKEGKAYIKGVISMIVTFSCTYSKSFKNVHILYACDRYLGMSSMRELVQCFFFFLCFVNGCIFRGRVCSGG